MTAHDAMLSLRGLRDWDAALIFCVMCAGGAMAGEPFRQLKGSEITARLAGQEFTDGVHWGLVFAKGGRLLSDERGGPMTVGARDPNVGTWRVEGNTICLTLGEGDPRCREVWVSGRNAQLRGPGDETLDGILRKLNAPP